MSNLGPQRINQSFGDLLQLPNGLTPAIQNVQDGSGNVTPLEISTTVVDFPISSPSGTSGMISDLATDAGSDYIGFLQAGTSAVTNRSVQDKGRESVSVLDFGAIGDWNGSTGTNNTTAFENFFNYLKTSKKAGYIPAGNYFVTAIDTSAENASGFNNGLTLFGDGKNSSFITIIPGTNNSGIGWDLSGAAFVDMSGFSIIAGSSSTNCPQVALLISKVNWLGGLIFSGIMRLNINVYAWGSYGVYNLGAEQITWQDFAFLGLHSQCTPYVISKVNTAGITSPNTTLYYPADSMTMVSHNDASSYIEALGTQAILFDVGNSSIAEISFNGTYFPLRGATTVCFKDISSGGLLSNISASNVRFEGNGGAGTNKAAVFTSQLINCHFHATYASGGSSVTLWTFSSFLSSFLSQRGNEGGSFSGMVSASDSTGSIYQVGATLNTVSVGSGDCTVYGTDGQLTYYKNAAISPGSSDNTLYQLQKYNGGVVSSGNSNGGLYRQSTPNVSTIATAILGPLSFGELVIVTGVGGGAIFADLLMCSYNTVTVISSNTQQGGPATRTYAISTGSLTLTMGSATAMNIIAQSIRTGAQGA